MDMKGTNFTFGQINYCQGFFTPGIWMSVSASFILIGILSFALSFLLGINTMDKFDDPKSKPLLIAQEK
jgi:V-type H+-transporting ATPase S1 subunit